MEFPKKTVALLLVIVALTAALESMPRYLVASIAVPNPASGPTNESPYGGSNLVRLAGEAGYNVSIIYGPETISRLPGAEVGIVLVAPYNLPDSYIDRLLDAIDEKIRDGGLVYVLIADELPGNANKLLDRLHERLCPLAPRAMLGDLMMQDSVKVILYTGHGAVETVTGKTSYINVYGVEPAPGVKPPPPRVEPGVTTIWGVYAYAWPGTDPLPPLSWYPLAYSCKSRYGGLGVVADSTLFINSMLSSSNTSREAAVAVLRSTFGPPRDTLVLAFDQEPYVDPTLRVDARIRFHPSFILLALASIYREVEERVIGIARTHYPALTAIILLASVLVLTAFPPWMRGVSKSRRKRPRKPMARVEEAPSYCMVYRRLAGHRIPRNRGIDLACSLSGKPLIGRFFRDPDRRALEWLTDNGWNPLDEVLRGRG